MGVTRGGQPGVPSLPTIYPRNFVCRSRRCLPRRDENPRILHIAHPSIISVRYLGQFLFQGSQIAILKIARMFWRCWVPVPSHVIRLPPIDHRELRIFCLPAPKSGSASIGLQGVGPGCAIFSCSDNGRLRPLHLPHSTKPGVPFHSHALACSSPVLFWLPSTRVRHVLLLAAPLGMRYSPRLFPPTAPLRELEVVPREPVSFSPVTDPPCHLCSLAQSA